MDVNEKRELRHHLMLDGTPHDEVDIEPVVDEEFVEPGGPTELLFHGTRAVHIPAILEDPQGLLLPKSDFEYANGALGKAVYFSKLRTATWFSPPEGGWGINGGRNQPLAVLLCRVDVGSQHIFDAPQPPCGVVWAMGGNFGGYDVSKPPVGCCRLCCYAAARR